MTRSNEAEKLLIMVRTLADEWGVENILICVPMDWEGLDLDLSDQGLPSLFFTTEGTIRIAAFQGLNYAAKYEVDAARVLESMNETVAS